MTEAASWGAGSAMASETALMDQTKSTAKTVCAMCAALMTHPNPYPNYAHGLLDEEASLTFGFHFRLS